MQLVLRRGELPPTDYDDGRMDTPTKILYKMQSRLSCLSFSLSFSWYLQAKRESSLRYDENPSHGEWHIVIFDCEWNLSNSQCKLERSNRLHKSELLSLSHVLHIVHTFPRDRPITTTSKICISMCSSCCMCIGIYLLHDIQHIMHILSFSTSFDQLQLQLTEDFFDNLFCVLHISTYVGIFKAYREVVWWNLVVVGRWEQLLYQHHHHLS